MKAISFLRSTACAALLLFSAATEAQQPTAAVQVAKTDIAKNLTKSDIATTDASKDEIVLDDLKLRSERLYRHFKNNFKEANDISVYPYEKSLVVYCMVNGIRNNILYSNKGRMLHAIRYYNADGLPSDVSNTVNNAFRDFSMSHVIEVTTDNGTAYLVTVENKKQFKVVRVVDGSWDVYQEYDKQ